MSGDAFVTTKLVGKATNLLVQWDRCTNCIPKNDRFHWEFHQKGYTMAVAQAVHRSWLQVPKARSQLLAALAALCFHAVAL